MAVQLEERLEEALTEIITDGGDPGYPTDWETLWECLTRPYGYGKDFPELREESVRAVLAVMVKTGTIDDVSTASTPAWIEPPPKAPAFIHEVAKKIGVRPLRAYGGHNDETHEFVIPLEPLIRRSFYTEDADMEKIRDRDTQQEKHKLQFRRLVGWSDDAWLCTLDDYRCYLQSTWDEDDESRQPSTPEEAFDGLLMRLDEEIALFQETRATLLRARDGS